MAPRATRPNARSSTRSTTRRSARQTAPSAGKERGSRATNRLVILLLVLGALVISYGSSLRAYLRQQDQIHQLDAQIAASKAASSANEQERKRLDDPSYIKTLARLRFGWVMPGQTPYVVLGTDGKPLDSKAQLDAHPPTTQESPDAWWDRVTGSLLTADNPPVTTTVKKPTPEKKIP